METTFKYKGKIITTPNLEKKLKRMKISINDIEIIDTPIIKKEDDSNKLDDFHLTHKPYLEPLVNGGYALHYLLNDPPSNWILGKIENGKIIPN